MKILLLKQYSQSKDSVNRKIDVKIHHVYVDAHKISHMVLYIFVTRLEIDKNKINK